MIPPEGLAASERVFDLLDTTPDLIDTSDAKLLPEIEGYVDFDHVSFSYKDNEPVLNNL